MTARARKRVLLSSLISATATIAVAFVAILPWLRERDRQTIAAQESRIEQLARKVAAFEKALGVGPSDGMPRVRCGVDGSPFSDAPLRALATASLPPRQGNLP